MTTEKSGQDKIKQRRAEAAKKYSELTKIPFSAWTSGERLFYSNYETLIKFGCIRYR